MDKFMLQKESPVERIKTLQDSADKVEDFSYTKPFTPDEIRVFKDELSTTMIESNEKEEEFKVVKDEHKAVMKPLKEKTKKLLTDIKNKASFKKEKCYVFIEGNEVGYYNAEGELVYQRPLMPGEQRKTIFSVLREGTND
jgi:hypothetical protein